MTIYIGIDPGLSGALAIIAPGDHIFIHDTPIVKSNGKSQYLIRNMVEIFESLHLTAGCCIGIEQVHAMPKQGVSSMFRMGEGLGIWKGIVAALGYSYEMITPKRWKKEMMQGMGKDKGASIIKAKQLFPNADIHLKKHDGRAEALLLAYYMKLKHSKGHEVM